jgi:hypothetical protein
MKKRTFRAGSILLTSLALGLSGCGGSEETKHAEAKPDPNAPHPGPAGEPGPVIPSPVPSLPDPNAPATDSKQAEMPK